MTQDSVFGFMVCVAMVMGWKTARYVLRKIERTSSPSWAWFIPLTPIFAIQFGVFVIILLIAAIVVSIFGESFTTPDPGLKCYFYVNAGSYFLASITHITRAKSVVRKFDRQFAKEQLIKIDD